MPFHWYSRKCNFLFFDFFSRLFYYFHFPFMWVYEHKTAHKQGKNGVCSMYGVPCTLSKYIYVFIYLHQILTVSVNWSKSAKCVYILFCVRRNMGFYTFLTHVVIVCVVWKFVSLKINSTFLSHFHFNDAKLGLEKKTKIKLCLLLFLFLIYMCNWRRRRKRIRSRNSCHQHGCVTVTTKTATTSTF